MQNVIYIVSGSEVNFVKYKSSYRYYRLVTVKIKLGVINSFRPGYVSSLACSLFLCFPCSQEKENFISIFAATQIQSHSEYWD